jgi:ubiquinone/menaquinone biosynthesis C-methylase UbiE
MIGNSKDEYVHGYSEREIERLVDQATTLAELLHHDTFYPPGSRVLEAGCGVGAQTVSLVRNSPTAFFSCMDISMEPLKKAKSALHAIDRKNATFHQADIFNLPFPEGCFDHIFICFVLEHLKNPETALRSLKSRLKPGGSITVIEGDHGSTYFHPASDHAWKTIQCLIDLQEKAGGDSLIGRRLYPLLSQAGFIDIEVSPRMVYVDSSRPQYVEGFTKNTFIAMVEGVESQAIDSGLIDRKTWEKGIKDLYRATSEDGTFCYTFFKGVGYK